MIYNLTRHLKCNAGNVLCYLYNFDSHSFFSIISHKMAFFVCFTKKFEILLSYERVSIAKPLTEDAPIGKGKRGLWRWETFCTILNQDKRELDWCKIFIWRAKCIYICLRERFCRTVIQNNIHRNLQTILPFWSIRTQVVCILAPSTWYIQSGIFWKNPFTMLTKYN